MSENEINNLSGYIHVILEILDQIESSRDGP